MLFKVGTGKHWPRSLPPTIVPVGAIHTRPAKPLPKVNQVTSSLTKETAIKKIKDKNTHRTIQGHAAGTAKCALMRTLRFMPAAQAITSTTLMCLN